MGISTRSTRSCNASHYTCFGILLRQTIYQHIDSHAIADEGLKELGPMSGREKSLIAIFILALVGWALPSILTQGFGIKFSLDATAVAIVAMVAALVTGVIKWEDMLESKGAWNTLIWFGGIIGMSSALSKVKFFEWLADFMGDTLQLRRQPDVGSYYHRRYQYRCSLLVRFW
nr:SLC13 family permease [Veillonella rogosae]